MSIAHLNIKKKYPLYEVITVDDRNNYFLINEKPITSIAENDMEIVSALVTNENLFNNWVEGNYSCSRCYNILYSSNDKWTGCGWASFRKSYHDEDSISTIDVDNYNSYSICVREVYCAKCDLFIGHQFEDAIAKGDVHTDARWRH
jgi:peptide methionine sulfoxide reductase MsrB